MKVLFIGYSTAWDAMAAALGYLRQPIDANPWFGDYNLEQKGAIEVGVDRLGREVYVLGSSRPQLVKKVVEELIKVGYPRADAVEVIVLQLPGQKRVSQMLRLARWPLLGTISKQYIAKWAAKQGRIWWQTGQSLSLKIK
ncbi:MAG: hypothetical protein ACM3NT_10410 [Methylocystaceae bacterium]